MPRYYELRKRLVDAGINISEMVPLPEEDISSIICQSGSFLPPAYLDFLREIGWGPLNEISLMIYNRLIGARSIFGSDTPEKWGRILIFGDDFSGYCYGFASANDWKIVGIGPTEMDIREISRSFEEFVWNRVNP